jgi:hypothetical protein
VKTMRPKLLWLILLVASLTCTPTQREPSLFVDVLWNNDLELAQLVFSGLLDDRDLIAPTTRPRVPSGMQLSSPQSVRMVMPDIAINQDVVIEVVGLSAGNEVAAFGRTDGGLRVVANDEVRGVVLLDPVREVPDDGGTPTGDGGQPDAGARCLCATGCCSGAECFAGPELIRASSSTATQAHCGVAGFQCLPSCDPLKTNRCTLLLQCACGNGPPCADGERCIEGVCRCNTATGCNGCCRGDRCLPRPMQASQGCGTGGLACENCNSNGKCDSGTCNGTRCEPGQCVSANRCESPRFPLCGHPTGICVSCDTLRANACGNTPSGCRCGALPIPCAPNQYCADVNGRAVCLPLPGR